jgi:hypothetical protein
MFQLATRPKHVFDAYKNEPADPARDRLPQAERTCKVCGLVKITAFPDKGDAFRMWRIPGVEQQFVCERTPDCVPAPQAKAAPEVSAA